MTELESACKTHGAHFDAANLRGSAVGLLLQLGVRIDHAITNLVDDAVVERALSAAGRVGALVQVTDAARQQRFDHADKSARSNGMEDLKRACDYHSARYDSDDERGSCLRLLAKLGYPGTWITGSGNRLDAQSEVYLATFAVKRSEANAGEQKYASSDRTDEGERRDVIGDGEADERLDAQRFDERRLDGLGDERYRRIGRSDATKRARQDFLDRQRTAWITDDEERKRHLAMLDQRTLEADAEVYAQLGGEPAPSISLERATADTDKARQACRDDHEKAWRQNYQEGALLKAGK